MIILMLLLNLGISWLNCWAVGGMWAETKATGGFPRLLAWCGAVQAAVGFSSVLLYGLGYVLHATGYMPDSAFKAAMQLWYVLVVVPAIGTGLFILIESWIIAFRTRSILDMASAAYNTFAMAHNIYGATKNMGSALSGVGDFFSTDGDGEGGGVVLLVVALVAASLLGGVILTAVLIRRYAGRLPDPRKHALAS